MWLNFVLLEEADSLVAIKLLPNMLTLSNRACFLLGFFFVNCAVKSLQYHDHDGMNVKHAHSM